MILYFHFDRKRKLIEKLKNSDHILVSIPPVNEVDLVIKNFSKNLDQGILVAEPRMGFNGPDTKKPGSPHDHGTAFRINPSLLDKIFAKSIRVV